MTDSSIHREMTMRALDRTQEPSQAREGLRLARSMRRGVSLAVWIRGSVAEIEAARKASSSEGSDHESLGTAVVLTGMN